MEELQNRIEDFLNKEDLTLEDRVQLLDDLYWADWNALNTNYPNEVKEIFKYLESSSLELEEMAKVLGLYNNVDGAHTEEFANIIANLYEKDRIKFLKALNLNKDEAINLVYIFRMIKIFDDGDKEFGEILDMNKLTEEEIDTANTFFNMYKTICNT